MSNNTPMSPQGMPAQTAGQQDYSQPVAYDQQGNPLYARPPQPEQGSRMVYLQRPLDPPHPELSDEVKARAEESRKKYPHLNLSEGEYIITAVKRHPIGLLQIWGGLTVVALLLIGLFAALVMQDASPLVAAIGDQEQVQTVGAVVLGGFTVLLALGGWAATYIYNGNRFYLTNESVIQEIQTSLFAKNEQTVSLANVEDASYKQTNPIQMLLNYGSIRLSTQGDETTYRFTYVTNPKQHIATLNNAVESFKNYRPVH
jgi:uncharacterized membrane protein YdbT with pleckstrin-like domain